MKKILLGFALGILIVPAFAYAAPDSVSSLATRLLGLEKRASSLEDRVQALEDRTTGKAVPDPSLSKTDIDKLSKQRADLISKYQAFYVAPAGSGVHFNATYQNSLAEQIRAIDAKLGTETNLCIKGSCGS